MLTRKLVALVLFGLLSACGGGGGGESTAALIVDPREDDDGDGLSTEDEENIYFSDPNDPDDPVLYGQFDHDNDGVANGADPDYNGSDDSDNDGLSNDWEYSKGLNPGSAEIILEEERLFSVVTPEYSWIKISLKTPSGDPISGAAFTISTDQPALIKAIYPAKGWVSDSNGVIEEPIIALGSGRSTLTLTSADRDDAPLVIKDIDSTLLPLEHNPVDSLRNYSSIKDNSVPGTGSAQSMLRSAVAWTPASKTSNEWIELPIDSGQRASALFIQGRDNAAQWVKQVKISYEIAPGYREYANNGQIFQANTDRDSIVRIPFNAPAGIESVRVHPVSWFITPSLRAALEVSNTSTPTPFDTDSDADGFSDLLESRIGSNPSDNNSPRLHNPPATERFYSSFDSTALLGTDGADGRIDAAAWRSSTTDTSPWTQLNVPANTKLVGLQIQGDPTQNAWVTTLDYADASVPGLLTPIANGEIQSVNSDASTAVNRWLPNNQAIKQLRIQPRTWQNLMGVRIALWVIDPFGMPHSNPLFSDLDGDGLNALQEQALQLDDNNPDVDGDGLEDGYENIMGSDPSSADGDNDGLLDQTELALNSNPASTDSLNQNGDQDSDNDGLSNAFEIYVLNTDPNLADTDGDGLSDLQETQTTFSDPLSADSDGDTLDDNEELTLNSNLRLNSSPALEPLLDADGDGLNNAREFQQNSDAEARDSDNDGLLDGEEYNNGSDPADPDSPLIGGASDTDGDGLSDAREQADGSSEIDSDDPVSFGSLDLDGDNLLNGIDPDYLANGDWDGDGISNVQEYSNGSDPRDSNSPTLGGAFDRDNDGIVNGIDADFTLNVSDDTDNDGLSDSVEYTAGHSATSAHVPFQGGEQDLDADTTKNNNDPDYTPTADFDSDGWNNAFEYRAGTDPTTANISTDFIDPVLTSTSDAASPVQILSLPDMGTSSPYYSSGPALLNQLSVTTNQALEILTDAHDGFDTADVSYLQLAGDAYVINDTPRHFRNLGLRDRNTGTLTRLQGDVLPFSRATLSAPLAGDIEVIDPNPLSHIHVESFQSLNASDSTQRLHASQISSIQQLVLANKKAMNQPAIWSALNATTSSGCLESICSSATVASDVLARLFYQNKAITHGLVSDSSAYTRLSWPDKLSIKASQLQNQSKYYQARALSLGIAADSGSLQAFSPVLSASTPVDLVQTQQRGAIWTEPGTYYLLSTDVPTLTLRLKHFSEKQYEALYLFNEDPASDLASVTFDSETAEFVLQLTQAQWDTGRLAVALQERNAAGAATLLLQWQASSVTWDSGTVQCAGEAPAPCHD